MPEDAGNVEQPQSYEEWREAFLTEYGSANNLTREQAWEQLANRPYPARIRIAAVFVGLMVILALVQSQGSFRTAVQVERARLLYDAGRYEETANMLEAVRKAGIASDTVDFLYGKTCLTIGDVRTADRLLTHMQVTKEQSAEVDTISAQMAEAGPEWKEAEKHLNAQDCSEECIVHLEHVVHSYPSFFPGRVALASEYGSMYFTTLDESWRAKYENQLKDIRHMYPSRARRLERDIGDLSKYKLAAGHSDAGDKLLNQGKVEEAITELKIGLADFPQHSKSHAYLAVAYARKYESTGDNRWRNDCLKEYRTAVELNPARVSVKPRLGALAKEAK